MRFLLLLAIFCVSVALIQPAVDFSASGLRQRAAELRPDIEAVLGEPLPWPVDIRASRPADLEKLLADETVLLMSEVEDGMRGRPLEEFAKAQAKVISRALFGKVELKTGVLHIVPDNLRWMSRLTKHLAGLRGQGVADVVLIHELVHVYQHHRHGLDRFFDGPRSIGELQARNAVTEGHAQYVTRRVAERRGLTESFELMLLAMRGPDIEADTTKQRILKALANLTAFAYVEGETFLDEVCREFGYEEGLRRALADPPTSTLMVSRPGDHLPWMADRKPFELAARRVERFLDESAPDVVRDVFPRDGVRTGIGLEAGNRSVDMRLCIHPNAARASHASLLGDGGGEPIELDGATAAFVATEDGMTVARLQDELVVGVTVAEPPHGRPGVVRLARRVLELVDSAFTDSPWSGLADRAAAQAACVAALDDDSWGVRWRAVRNLGRFEPEIEGVETAVRGRLADPEPIVRVAALKALRARDWDRPDDLATDDDWEIRSLR